MAFCPKCGANVPDGTPQCPQCGVQMNAAQSQQPQQNYNNTAPQGYPYGAPMGTPPSGQTNTGMLVWSIINIFFCTILGIVALVFTLNAKNEATAELEQKKLKTAKTLNILATVFGALSIIFTIIYAVVIVGIAGATMDYYY